jgi:hypothetical protein
MSTLETRILFDSDDKYLEFCDEYVSSCCISLAVAVGKDAVWKPLNHRILMLTRDKKSIVRIVAIKILKRLFAEVILKIYVLYLYYNYCNIFYK